MNMRQVHACLERISVRQHNHYAILGGFQGIEVELKEVGGAIAGIESATEEQKAMMKESALNSLDKLRLEKGKSNGKRGSDNKDRGSIR